MPNGAKPKTFLLLRQSGPVQYELIGEHSSEDTIINTMRGQGFRESHAGQEVLAVALLRRETMTNRREAAKAALRMAGWSDDDINAVFGDSDPVVDTAPEPSVPKPAPTPPATQEQETNLDIPDNWQEENRVRALREWVKKLPIDTEKVGKWTKDACKAALRQYFQQKAEVKPAPDPEPEDQPAPEKIEEAPPLISPPGVIQPPPPPNQPVQTGNGSPIDPSLRRIPPPPPPPPLKMDSPEGNDE